MCAHPAHHLFTLTPDSWSSGSSREGRLPQADMATWAKHELDDEASSRSPDASEDISSTLVEEPRTFAPTGNTGMDTNTSHHVPLSAPKKSCTTAANIPKAKVRAAFSESQMNALVQRFSVQRYLTPAEMKNLAELTGMTYKQVRDLRSLLDHKRCKIEFPVLSLTSWISFTFLEG